MFPCSILKELNSLDTVPKVSAITLRCQKGLFLLLCKLYTVPKQWDSTVVNFVWLYLNYKVLTHLVRHYSWCSRWAFLDEINIYTSRLRKGLPSLVMRDYIRSSKGLNRAKGWPFLYMRGNPFWRGCLWIGHWFLLLAFGLTVKYWLFLVSLECAGP